MGTWTLTEAVIPPAELKDRLFARLAYLSDMLKQVKGL